jgi:hypothetical protein
MQFAQPGTYDHLSHILYHPIPSPGSSGSPILDANTGSVVGIVTGAAMVNRVEGRRGFGTPAEALFEVSPSFVLLEFESPRLGRAFHAQCLKSHDVYFMIMILEHRC